MEKTALTHRISVSGRRREECRESGGKCFEATADLADDLRLRDVRDEEAMTGSGDSHIDEVSHLPFRFSRSPCAPYVVPSFKNVNLSGTSRIPHSFTLTLNPRLE